eukprot:CAMPEP_0182451024 /NCGR_PEP_ID=MMETSP1172-20130603/43491_1 /TAXON_ID=708627 /ORGANISM="Timspurckia oligopyrenoides, Strain CCMP3278" /LENGTH=524 /DNA_ID=CAMNT_0024648759 /DNA_START=17 /DNA_END=1591 /DNA_ORIENTATION=+
MAAPSSGALIRVIGDLFSYDPSSEKFILRISNAIATLEKDDSGSTSFLLHLYKPVDPEKLILEQIIADDMRHQFFSTELNFVWVLPPQLEDDEAKIETQCFSLRLKTAGDFVQFRNQFSVCLFESKLDFSKLNVSDQSWVRDSERDDVPMDLSSDETEEETDDEGNPKYSKLGDEKSGVKVGGKQSDDDDEEEDREAFNSQLALGYSTDRAFVVRGTKMGVFKSSEDGLDYQSMMKFKQKDGHGFHPGQIMLHQQDQSMLLLDPKNPNKVMRMDVERGSIVDEWGGLTNSVGNIARPEKYANLTANPEFVALNENALMRMDPRTRELVVQTKAYAKGTRAKLACMATTGAGYVAVASQNGDIRLFDQIGKNAKTHLPGLGVPIRGIDVTEDGTFVLATTKDFLLLIDTRVRGEEKGGFLKSMGQKKPPPLRLALRPEDITKHKIRNVDFTVAHFNTGNSLEKNIVTSTGPFVVVWNLRQVKQGKRNAYQIKRYRDNVVADEFEYNNDGKIIVTLPNDVTYNAMK